MTMKIRSDYVSNSSSSSFIVALPKDYEFKKFIKDVARSCVANPDWDGYKKEDIDRIKGMNIRNLDYCLNTHELLFLGQFCYGYGRTTIKGKKKVADYMKSHNYIKEHYPNVFHDKIASQTDSKIVVDFPNVASYCTLPWDRMHIVRKWQEANENTKDIVDGIVKEVSREHEDCSGLYEITMNTILNTEALIAERPDDIKLDKWCSDLNKLKKMVENGDRIFGIDMHQSGDGESSTSIYALSGWDSDAFKYADVQILDCECG